MINRNFRVGAVTVVLLAWVLRVVALFDIPPGLAQDEVLNADIALFIQQGRHALFFREGFGHEPLFHYWATIFQILLGDNWLSIRLPSAVLGTFLVALVIAWLNGRRPVWMALGTGILLAVGWWPLIFSRIGIRPIMLPLFLVAVAWLWGRRRPLAAGLVLGLSMYTYTAARAMLLLPLALYLYEWVRGRFERPAGRPGGQLRAAAVLGGTALAIYMPLQLTLWRDPSLQQRVEQLSGPLTLLLEGDWRPIAGTIGQTLGAFALTGDPRWTYTVPELPLFDPLTGGMFYLGAAWLVWRAVKSRQAAYLAYWLVLGLLPSALSPQAPSMIRLVAMLPVAFLAVLEGIAFLGRLMEQRLGRRVARPAVFLLLGGTILLTGWRTAAFGLTVWPAALETRLRYGTVWREIGRAWVHTPDIVPVVADSWAEPIDHDSLQRNLGRPVPARWIQTGAGTAAGALVFPPDEARLYVPEFAPLPIELLEMAGIEQPLFRQNDFPSFAVYSLPNSPSLPLLDRPVRFEDRLTLLGWKWTNSPTGAEQAMILLTYWRVEAPLPAGTAIFLHLTGENPTPLAQHDGFDALAGRLLPGDAVLQRHVVLLPPDLPSGDYDLRLGVYERDSGRRWLQNLDGAEALLMAGVTFDGRALNR